MTTGTRTVAVCGATGRQGGAVARSLLESGWVVRALTRLPGQERAATLSELGAEVVAADMEDPASLRRAFEGVDGVFSVQNGMISGFDREVVQGRNVADAAKQANVGHLVYAAAGTGQDGFGIPSW
ncbi:MAG: NmrA family NAD(P)-binding protein, partial [Acidimicrobiia bacterium]